MDPIEAATDHLQERAEEAIEEVREEAAKERTRERRETSRKRRLSAVVIAILGTAGTLCELSASEAQNGQLRHNIESENIWNHYQAKSVRRAILQTGGQILSHDPRAASDAGIAHDIEFDAAEARRMVSDPAKGDGMEQLAEAAHREEEMRDHDERLHARLESGSKAIGISVVFTAMAIGIDSMMVLGGAATLGAAAVVYAGAVVLGYI